MRDDATRLPRKKTTNMAATSAEHERRLLKKRDQWFHHVGSVHHMSDLAEVCKFKKKKKNP